MTDLTKLGIRSRKTAKIVSPSEPVKKRTYNESSEQGTIALYIKRKYPKIMFETVEREGARTYRAMNQIKLNNTHSGWPDTRIYESRCGYHSLMIENKKAGSKLMQVRNPKRFHNEHYENQYKTHRLLIDRGHAVYFACGISEAIEILERYLDGNPMPFLEVDFEPFYW